MMDIQQAKYHLKRIQAIIDLQSQGLSELDRNILLEDIKNLYEIVVFAGAKENDPKESTFHTNSTTPVTQEEPELPSRPASSRPDESHFSEAFSTPKTDETPKPKENLVSSETTPPSPTSPLPITDNPVEPIREEHTIDTADHQLQEKSIQNNPPAFDQNETITKEPEVTESYPELFDFKATDDLSEKLGNSKVEQLNHILAINDKILYINHLFGGEAIPFQESLKKFESFYTYEEAKSFATKELVEKYHWTDPARMETVKQFMKQVRRLYS